MLNITTGNYLGTSFIPQNVKEGTLYKTVVTMDVVATVMSIVE